VVVAVVVRAEVAGLEPLAVMLVVMAAEPAVVVARAAVSLPVRTMGLRAATKSAVVAGQP